MVGGIIRMVDHVANIYKDISEKRKKLQEEGLIPDWYTTAGLQMFDEKYRYQTTSVKEQFRRIAKTAANHTPIEFRTEAEYKFFELLWRGWLSPSTPVLANTGTDRGMPVSCSGGTIQDSIEGFYNGRRETAILTKYGFGTSSYLGNVRPRGSKISVGGKASGVVPVYKGFVQDMRDVAQGTARRGAWAGYLPIDHGDFDELADFILAEPDDANVGWNISDKFIEQLDNGDIEAIRRYQKALKIKMVTGKGYFFFVDKANRNSPESYKKHGLDIKASNLCFTGETLVAVADGRNAVSIKQLAEESNGVIKFPVYSAKWNGEKWISEVKNAVAFKTGRSKIVEVTLSDSSTFRCTPEHSIALLGGGYIEAYNSSQMIIQGYSNENVDDCNQLNDGVFSVYIKRLPDEEYTYDLTVEDNHNFNIINSRNVSEKETYFGILVHNCSEIMLHSDEDHTFTCVLSSMNVSKYDEWKDIDAVYWATVFLDCVAEEFIQRGRGIPGLENAVRFTEKGRALGLGVCGFHTYLQQNMIPFESLEAMWKNNEIFSHIDIESKKASNWLAMLLGEPEWCKGTGLRNTHRIAIAPTKSTAVMMGGVSEGINPDPAMIYTQTTAAGEVDRINPVLLNLMKERGVYNKKTLNGITDKMGSVQHVTWLTDVEKQVFKTAFEINQEVVLRLASQRAKYIDQWQSLNLFFSSEENEEWISHVHKQAFKDPNILALYYVYSRAGVQASKECESCQ